MTFTTAGRDVSPDEAFERLRDYGGLHARTIEFYDHGGQDTPNAVTLADIGRLVVIDARLSGNDVRGNGP